MFYLRLVPVANADLAAVRNNRLDRGHLFTNGSIAFHGSLKVPNHDVPSVLSDNSSIEGLRYISIAAYRAYLTTLWIYGKELLNICVRLNGILNLDCLVAGRVKYVRCMPIYDGLDSCANLFIIAQPATFFHAKPRIV